jgi:hypothetical protein
VFEDRANTALPQSPERQSALASGFQTLRAVTFGQREQAEARAIRELRMLSRLDQEAYEIAGMGTNLDRPVEETSGTPFAVRAMMRGHMFRDRRMAAESIGTSVRGDTLVVMKKLDSRGSDADVELKTSERMRNAVVVAMDFDVIVNVLCAQPHNTFYVANSVMWHPPPNCPIARLLCRTDAT